MLTLLHVLLFCFAFKQKTRHDRVWIPDVRSERTVPRLRCPSLQHFRKHFLVPGRPVILEGVADQWPCMKKWRWVAVRPGSLLGPFQDPASTSLPPPGNAASHTLPDRSLRGLLRLNKVALLQVHARGRKIRGVLSSLAQSRCFSECSRGGAALSLFVAFCRI